MDAAPPAPPYLPYLQARVADTIDFKLLERLPTKNPDSLRELLHEVEQPVDRRLGACDAGGGWCSGAGQAVRRGRRR